MSHSQQPSQIPASNQNRQLNIGYESPNDTFRLQLNSQQAAFLAKLLPTCYSFQVEPKSAKRLASTAKISTQQPKVSLAAKKKPTKEEPKSTNSTKPAIGRLQKVNSNRINQENENAVYQKYNVQKDFRKNSFENVSEALRPCIRILTSLKNSRTSWPFREPVDPIALGIPHYTEIIKQPMDLSTIENNLRTNQYITPTQFHADVAKIITNSYTFNASNIEFTRVTAQFEGYYRKIISDQSLEIPRSYSQQEYAPEAITSKIANLEIKKSKKQSKDQYNKTTGQVISMDEKKQLGQNIKKLPKECMKGILDIVNEGKGKIIGEFDLQELDLQIIRKLQIYVNEKLSGQSRAKGSFGNQKKHVQQEESSFEVGEQSQS